MADHVDSLVPGDLVAGKFRVERVIGRGGMGVVIAATNVQLGQRVAMKFLKTGAEDRAVVERFTNEARAAAKLRSEHVARIYDVGNDALRGPFIVMELLDGSNLADVLVKNGRLPIQRAAEYIIDACEGLAEAHARGIVHQDIKPANLFVTTSNDGKPTVKVLDFGIARMTSAPPGDSAQKTPSHGSPHYLAPEQLRAAAAVDRRADLWALGCVLHELVTGTKAFAASRFVELVANILEGKRAPMIAGLDLPPPLLDIIARCLEVDPQRRWKSSGELAIALLPLARRRAHAVAAMAVARVREAGIDPSLEMPASLPPPSDRESSDPIIDLLSSSKIPRAAPVPVIDAFAPTTPPPSDPRTSVSPSTATAPPGERPARSRTPLVVGVVAALLLVGIGGVAIAVKSRGEPTVATSAPPPIASTAPVVAPPPKAPLPSAEPEEPANPVAVPGTSASAPVVPVRAVAVPSRRTPAPPTSPSTRTPGSSSTGTAQPPKMDIERNR